MIETVHLNLFEDNLVKYTALPLRPPFINYDYNFIKVY